MRLLDLPDELLAQIAASITFLEITHLQTVCKQWKRVVEESPSLQYRIQLGVVGRAERAEVPASLGVQDTLRLLHEDLDVWSSGHLRNVGTFKNSTRSFIKAPLVNCGIFAASHPRRGPVPEGVNPNHLHHISVPNDHGPPSPYHSLPTKSWSLLLEGGILIVDPAQNLLLSRAKTSADAAVVCSALTLDTGAPHPACTNPGTPLAVPAPAEWIAAAPHYTRFSVIESTLLVTFADMTRCANVFLDWWTGRVLATFNTPSFEHASVHRRPSAPALISSQAFIYGSFDAETRDSSIDLYILSTRPLLIKRFLLPLLNDVRMACVIVSSFPRNRTMPQPSSNTPSVPMFHGDPLSSMVLVVLHLFSSVAFHLYDPPEILQFFTPLWPFLVDSELPRALRAPPTPPTVLWLAWGPERTRWVTEGQEEAQSHLQAGFAAHREGSRMLLSGRLIDFAPFAARNPRYHAKYHGFRLVVAPTVIRHALLRDGVVSRLPYFERDLPNPDADDFLFLGRTVVSIHAGFAEMDVYRLSL